MISRVANLRVRSVGTLGGNLCFADPAEFLTGPYETAMRPGNCCSPSNCRPARRVPALPIYE
jgi:hypothetical protein